MRGYATADHVRWRDARAGRSPSLRGRRGGAREALAARGAFPSLCVSETCIGCAGGLP